jgi:hypothetical protein
VTTEGKPANVESLKKYINVNSIRQQHTKSESILRKIHVYFFGDFRERSGFYIAINDQENLFLRQIRDIMKDTMANVSIDSIMHCHVNNQDLTLRNVLANFCPDVLESERMKRHVHEKMNDKRKALMKALLENLITGKELNPITLGILALKANISKEEVNFFKDMRQGLKNSLKTCGTHTTILDCKDTSKDFCPRGALSFGLVILLAILLPGLIQGVGNVILHRVKISNNLLVLVMSNYHRPLSFLSALGLNTNRNFPKSLIWLS